MLQQTYLDQISKPPFQHLCHQHNYHKNEQCIICHQTMNFLNRKLCKFCGFISCSSHFLKKRKDPVHPHSFYKICMKCDKKYLQIVSNKQKQIERLQKEQDDLVLRTKDIKIILDKNILDIEQQQLKFQKNKKQVINKISKIEGHQVRVNRANKFQEDGIEQIKTNMHKYQQSIDHNHQVIKDTQECKISLENEIGDLQAKIDRKNQVIREQQMQAYNNTMDSNYSSKEQISKIDEIITNSKLRTARVIGSYYSRHGITKSVNSKKKDVKIDDDNGICKICTKQNCLIF